MSTLEVFSSSAWITASPNPPPLFPMNLTNIPPDNGDWIFPPEVDGAFDEQTRNHLRHRRRRRHLNIPVNNRPRLAQLYSTRQKHFVQIRQDGKIRTTTQSDSVFSIFEVLLWCSIVSSPLYPCLSESNESSVFGVILFHFKQTDRYLCLNSKGHLFTAKTSEVVDEGECAFQHEIVWQNHDIYYSWKYPNNTNRSSFNPSPETVNDTGSSLPSDVSISDDDSASALFSECQSKWFLGVSREGRPRTYRRGNCNRLRKNILFIQRWFHRPSDQFDFQNPYIGTQPTEVATGETRDFQRNRPRERKRDHKPPPFQILLGRQISSKGENSGTRKSERKDEGTDKSITCHNLLMNCNRKHRGGLRKRHRPK